MDELRLGRQQISERTRVELVTENALSREDRLLGGRVEIEMNGRGAGELESRARDAVVKIDVEEVREIDDECLFDDDEAVRRVVVRNERKVKRRKHRVSSKHGKSLDYGRFRTSQQLKLVEHNTLLYADYWVRSAEYWRDAAWKYSMWSPTNEEKAAFEQRMEKSYCGSADSFVQLSYEAFFARTFLVQRVKIPQEVVLHHIYPFLFWGMLSDPELYRILGKDNVGVLFI